MALCPGLPGGEGNRKVKPIRIYWSISWTICKSVPHSRQITMPPLGWMPFLPPNRQHQRIEGCLTISDKTKRVKIISFIPQSMSRNCANIISLATTLKTTNKHPLKSRRFPTMLNDFNEALEMRQDGTAHEDWNLLAYLDASMSSLPRLLALTDGLQERQQSGNAERRRNDGECSRRRVTHVLVHVVNIWTHRRDHRRQPGRLQLPHFSNITLHNSHGPPPLVMTYKTYTQGFIDIWLASCLPHSSTAGFKSIISSKNGPEISTFHMLATPTTIIIIIIQHLYSAIVSYAGCRGANIFHCLTSSSSVPLLHADTLPDWLILIP